MQGLLAKSITFTYYESQDELGLLYEIFSRNKNVKSTLDFSNTYEFYGTGIIDSQNLKVSQLAMVVKDAKETARQYKKWY